MNRKNNPALAGRDLDNETGNLLNDPIMADNGGQVKVFNGEWPCACMLAFHRTSFGILDGEVILKIGFKNGQFDRVQAWRGDYDVS